MHCHILFTKAPCHIRNEICYLFFEFEVKVFLKIILGGGGMRKFVIVPIYPGPPPALYPERQRRRASTARQGFLLCRAGSDIQSSGPKHQEINFKKILTGMGSLKKGFINYFTLPTL